MNQREVISQYICLNSSEIFKDIDALLLDKARNEWERKNFKGKHIIKVHGIVNRGGITINNTSLKGESTVSTFFDIQTIHYEKYDVVVGTITVINNDGEFIVVNDHAIIKMNNSEHTKAFAINDKIPMYVMQSMYTPGKDKISMTSIPFVPFNNIDIYILTSVPTIDLIAHFKLMDEYEDKISDLTKTKEYKHFVDMLSTKKKPGTYKSIRDIKNSFIENTIISRRNLMLKPEYEVHKPSKNIDYVELPANVIIETIVYSYIRELQNLITLCESYDMAEIAAHKHVWAVYNSFKM